MKNLKQKIILCAGIILIGLIAACSNPFIEPDNEPAKSKGGTAGNVLISVAGSNGRTILPATAGFSRYALEVAGAGNFTVPEDISGITGNGVSMTLPAGLYTVTVRAYRASGGNEYLAAQGSKTVTVTSGLAAVVIDLKPFIGEENGFFSYHITLPGGTETAALNLKAADGSYDEEFNLKDSAVSSAPIELPAGYYELFISLAKGSVESGEYAAVHIYSGMETSAVLDLSNCFDTINLETLMKVIEDAGKELARLEAGGDIKISVDGKDVSIGLLWVTQTAADTLQTALETAQDVVASPPGNQRVVNDARRSLEAVLATFEPQQGTNFSGGYTGLITEVGTPVILTINSGAWTFSVPLASGTNATGTYTLSDDGKVTFMRDDAVFAIGTLSATDDTLDLILATAVLGANTVTLTEGTAPAPAADIEYLYSGIWTDKGTTPVITYISSDKWTFSLPYEGEQANGTFRVYDRKAAFFKTDGTFFAVGKVATEQAELTGNTLTVYPVIGGSFALTLNPYPNPYIGNWQGGDTIGGTLYVSITTWTLEDASGNVLTAGEYVWDGNEAYFISGGARFATGTINDAKNTLTVAVNNSVPVFGGLEQEFTLITSPFIGNWRATIALVVNIDAAVTTNTYAITSIAGNANGQYVWRTENGTTKAYFYSNGYSYGVATLSTATRINVALTEPISAPLIGTISTLTMNKR
jgi:hypothetical protein